MSQGFVDINGLLGVWLARPLILVAGTGILTEAAVALTACTEAAVAGGMTTESAVAAGVTTETVDGSQ